VKLSDNFNDYARQYQQGAVTFALPTKISSKSRSRQNPERGYDEADDNGEDYEMQSDDDYSQDDDFQPD